MKNINRHFWIFTLVVIVGFSMITCKDDDKRLSIKTTVRTVAPSSSRNIMRSAGTVVTKLEFYINGLTIADGIRSGGLHFVGDFSDIPQVEQRFKNDGWYDFTSNTSLTVVQQSSGTFQIGNYPEMCLWIGAVRINGQEFRFGGHQGLEEGPRIIYSNSNTLITSHFQGGGFIFSKDWGKVWNGLNLQEDTNELVAIFSVDDLDGLIDGNGALVDEWWKKINVTTEVK